MNLIGADRKRKRYAGQLLGLLTSTIALAFFIYAFDLEDLKKIVSQLDPYSVPLAVFWLLAFNSIFALRWYFILNHRLSIASSLYAVFMGIGANMFLPARGGDVLRLAYSHRAGPVPLPLLAGGVFVEKLLDLVAVACLAFLALFLNSGIRDYLPVQQLVLLPSVMILTLLLVFLLIAWKQDLPDRLLKLLKRVPLLSGILPASLGQTFVDARELFRPLNIFLAAFATTFLWFLSYPLAYFLAGRLLGADLPYSHLVVITIAGALGVALPAVPSGLGVLHASLISAFLLLGRSAADGLAYATTVHLLWFLVFGSIGMLLYFRWALLRRRSAEPR